MCARGSYNLFQFFSMNTIYFTGFADEASRNLDEQIKATKQLGWSAISLRMIGEHNVHELPEEQFLLAADKLDQAGITVPEFGSLIGNWGKSIATDFEITLAEIERAIVRMQRLDCKLVRIMSYAQQPWGEEQFEEERFRRLREIVARFADAGILAAHENCMNWGGFSAQHSLRLLEEVPGLKLIFDTGNPVFQLDRQRVSEEGAFPWQDPWDFWQQVRDFVVHVHVKDCLHPAEEGQEPQYVFPGEGQGRVKEIVADYLARNPQGWVAIEPHVATVFHAKEEKPNWQQAFQSYVEYGEALRKLLQ